MTSLSDCISENIAKFSQPKNPIYRIVYVINYCDHEVQSLETKKISRLVELVDNLNDCGLKERESEKSLPMSYEIRILHQMTLLSKNLFDDIKKGNVLFEVPIEMMLDFCGYGSCNFVFANMTRIV
tara:strand:- start:680 stop:1057 length:378 start_codon:yes stop_codon:yes gene_type:complete